MSLLHQLVDGISFSLSMVGVAIIVWGTVIALFELLKIKGGIAIKTSVVKLNEEIRLKLGSYLILALEFFIASDIVRTIIVPTWESLGILGAIIVIRTVLSYFLTKELNEKDERSI